MVLLIVRKVHWCMREVGTDKHKRRKKTMDRGTFVFVYVIPFLIAAVIALWLWMLDTYLWTK
jgi:hypothetical protein